MNDQLKELRSRVDQMKGSRSAYVEMMLDTKEKIDDLTRKRKHQEHARTVLQSVALATQGNVKMHVTAPVSMALAAVFDDPYEFVVDIVLKRNRTEVEVFFERHGHRIDPMSSSGGGAVNVACFALRLALWKLSQRHTRPVFVLDEPFTELSVDLQPRAVEMLKKVSEQLGLQIIMVTHAAEAVEGADRVHTVSLRNGVSTVA